MLLQLLLAVATSAPADTLLPPDLILLGEPIEAPTYVAVKPAPAPAIPPTPGRIVSFAARASVPLPFVNLPGLPEHLVQVPTELGVTRSELEHALLSVEQEVKRGGFPGAALAIGRWQNPVLERGIGTLERSLGASVDPDHTMYDLASLTKVIATTTAVMLLVEDRRMSLDAPVSTYLPDFTGGNKDRVTIRHLLTHTSGLPAGGNTAGATPRESLARAIAIPLIRKPGQKVEYSDIGFIVLWAAAEAANMGPLDRMLQLRVFEPLGMSSTDFRPGESCVRCAPTLDRPGYRGVVHDPIARRLGGIAGNAGLFSTAHDLGRFAAMLATGGELEGVRVLKRETIEEFTRRQPGTGTRALGWDTPSSRGTGASGVQISSSGFGHTGFTGTSLWVDPVRGTWVVFLSNHTYYPRVTNRMQALRRELNDRVALSVDEAPTGR